MNIQVNPFEDDIVVEPRNVKNSVSSLNEYPLKKLLDSFQALTQDPVPKKSRLSHAFLILSAEPGNGKSHLIGRLFHELSEKSTLIYIRPFENVSTCWKSILLKIVQELGFPDKLDSKSYDQEPPSQLEVFSHGILVYLLSEARKNGLIQAKEEKSVVRIRGNVHLLKFLNDANGVNWVFSVLDKLAIQFVQLLGSNGITLNASALSWIKVLLNYTYNRQKIDVREACLEWLKGECLDLDEAKMIGIRIKDISLPEMTSDEINELCKLRILDICHLAAFFRPFLFCFDQTENFGKDAELVKTFGLVIENLVDACPNQMTVVTANQTPWENSILPSLEEAHAHRFSAPLELEGINKGLGKELIKQRLAIFKTDSDVAQYFAEDNWLNNLFKDKTQIGIRRFIHACRYQWDKEKHREIKRTSIEDCFEKNIKEIKSQPKRHVFEPDILYWMIFEVAKGIKGITVKKHSTEKGYFVIQWLLDRHSILFGFESGSNSIRWRSIAREAKRYSIAKKGLKAVMLRTFELPKIPRPTWKKIGPEIEAAKKGYLDIIHLNKDDVVELYAANELYRDAIEGDIPYSLIEALEFIRKRLKWLWDRIIWDLHDEKEKGKIDSEISCSGNVINEIKANIKREKLLSVDELSANLPGSLNKELIFNLCKKIPEIKVYKSPEISILQWQSNR